MVDIKLVRNDPEFVKAAVRKREMNLDTVIDEILEIDAERRRLSGETDALKAQQNAASKKIPQIKKEGGDVSAIMAEMKELSARVKETCGESDAKRQGHYFFFAEMVQDEKNVLYLWHEGLCCARCAVAPAESNNH